MFLQRNYEGYFGELDKNYARIKHQYSNLMIENKKMKLSQKILKSFDFKGSSEKTEECEIIMTENKINNKEQIKATFNLSNYKNINEDNVEDVLLKQFLTKVEKNNFLKTNKKLRANSMFYHNIINKTQNQDTSNMPKIINNREKTTKILFNSNGKCNFPRKEKSDMGIGSSNIFKTLKRIPKNNDALLLFNSNDNKREYSDRKNFNKMIRKINNEVLNTTLSKNELLEKIKIFNKKCLESENKNPPKEIYGRDYIMINGEKIKAHKNIKYNKSVDYSKIRCSKDIEKKILKIDTKNLISNLKKISLHKRPKKETNLKNLPKLDEINKNNSKLILPICPTSHNFS